MDSEAAASSPSSSRTRPFGAARSSSQPPPPTQRTVSRNGESFAEPEADREGVAQERHARVRAERDVLQAEHADADVGEGEVEARGDALGRDVDVRRVGEAVEGDEFPEGVDEGERADELDPAEDDVDLRLSRRGGVEADPAELQPHQAAVAVADQVELEVDHLGGDVDAGAAAAEAWTTTSMRRPRGSRGSKILGTPGRPHGVMSGRHSSRAVILPAATSSISRATSDAVSSNGDRASTIPASRARIAPDARQRGARSPPRRGRRRAPSPVREGREPIPEAFQRREERGGGGLDGRGAGGHFVAGPPRHLPRAVMGGVGDILAEAVLGVGQLFSRAISDESAATAPAASETNAGASSRPRRREDLGQREQPEQLREERGVEELLRVERAARQRGRVAADRAQRPGDALHRQAGGDEPARAVRAAGEVDARRGREIEDQLPLVGGRSRCAGPGAVAAAPSRDSPG